MLIVPIDTNIKPAITIVHKPGRGWSPRNKIPRRLGMANSVENNELFTRLILSL
jgi:hypothetical protein